MTNLLTDAFDQENLPFYFKFDNAGGKRDDTLVLYCSDEDLEKTYQILKQIKVSHQDIVNRAGAPVMLAGKIYCSRQTNRSRPQPQISRRPHQLLRQ